MGTRVGRFVGITVFIHWSSIVATRGSVPNYATRHYAYIVRNVLKLWQSKFCAM